MTAQSSPTINDVAAPDPITERVRATWTSGDFGQIARGYEQGAAEFIARLGLTSTERVLDVACGTGNLTIPAARARASVTGLDIAPNLIAPGTGSRGGGRPVDRPRRRRCRVDAV